MGDTDVFPFPFENHIFHDTPDPVVSLLAEIPNDVNKAIQQLPLYNVSMLSANGYNGFRWATQIDPIWNVYLLGLVLELAPAIEALRIAASDEVVFSYRYQEVRIQACSG